MNRMKTWINNVASMGEQQPLSQLRWEPCGIDGEAVAIGATGRWLDSGDDLVATDAASLRIDRLPLDFPSDWPGAFQRPGGLRTLINKKLRGARCRVVGALGPADTKALLKAGVKARPLNSFHNALALSAACGWGIAKGFMVFERLECDEKSYVAVRHWWNVRDDVWINATPPHIPPFPGAEERCLLVESDKGEKPPSELTVRRRDFAVSVASRLVSGGAIVIARTLLAKGLPDLPAAAAPSSAASDTLSAASSGDEDAMTGGGRHGSQASSGRSSGDEATPAAAARPADSGGGAFEREEGPRALPPRWSSYEFYSQWDKVGDNELGEEDEGEPQLSAAQKMEAEYKAAVQDGVAKVASRLPRDARQKPAAPVRGLTGGAAEAWRARPL